MNKYELATLKFCERYGIMDYKIIGNKLVYYETFSDGTRKWTVNLDTLKASGVLLKKKRLA